jgi:hypothetical protein
MLTALAGLGDPAKRLSSRKGCVPLCGPTKRSPAPSTRSFIQAAELNADKNELGRVNGTWRAHSHACCRVWRAFRCHSREQFIEYGTLIDCRLLFLKRTCT